MDGSIFSTEENQAEQDAYQETTADEGLQNAEEEAEPEITLEEDSDQDEATVAETDDFDEDEEAEPAQASSSQSSRLPTPDLSDEELDAIADVAIEVIRDILFFFNAEEAVIEEFEGDEKELIFDVVGESLAMLIGRHGRTLEAMQYIVSAIVSKRIGYHYPIVVDVEGYVNRRKQKLVTLARSSAARAIRQKRSVRLRPMSPYERRVVHMALKDDDRIRTESEGVDPNRQVVIYLN